VKLSRAEFDARGRAREGCHAQWICHARAELLKRPSGEVAAGPSHPRFRRPRPHPFDDRNQLAPGALGTQPAAHFPPPPCSVGYPGRSRVWLRPCLFGSFRRPFTRTPRRTARMSIKVGTFPTTGGGRSGMRRTHGTWERRRANLSRGRCRSIARRPGTFSNGHHLGYMGSGFVTTSTNCNRR
jgi:hypothetical protein